MEKLWIFIKTRLLTKKFLSFGIIGVVNTGIHLLIYWICYNMLGFGGLTIGIGTTNLTLGAFLANTVAFVGASVFSYFANVIFTFKPAHTSTKQFSLVMSVFLLRLVIGSLLTSGFDFAILNWFRADYAAHAWMTIIAPFFGSALLIPVAYFALEYVFKKTDSEKK